MYTVEIYFLGHPSQAVISNSDRANRVIVMNSVVQLIEHHFKLEGEIEKKDHLVSACRILFEL